MLLRLIALGALGYVGYKYLEKNAETPEPARLGGPKLGGSEVGGPELGHPDIALAGGPLSSQATVQHTADDPPPSFV